MENLIETGMVVTTHGINGELKINPWSDTPEFLLQFQTIYIGKTPYQVRYARVQKNMVHIKLEGIDSIDQAMGLVNQVAAINREDAPLPEGTYYIADLIGCTVKDEADGTVYGVLKDVLKTGANDVYVISADDGENGTRELLAPVIPDVVKKVSMDKKEILICPLPGLFD